MAASWTPWRSLCLVFVTLLSGVMPQEDLFLSPLNSTVLQGSTVRFEATTQRTWDLMTWTLGDVLVLTISSDNTTTSSSDQFSASLCPGAGLSCVTFIIHSVTRKEDGPVACATLGFAGETTAQLEVQESGTVLIVGGNRTAVQNDQVEFQCEAVSWFPAPTFSWTRNGNLLDSALYTTNSTPHGDSFNSVSVLKFQAESSVTVQCLVTISTLPAPRSSSVFLEVDPDWTVLIAVVVSIGGFALLVLLIILIIFCYRRRKEKKPNYNDEMMRARTQSQISVQPPGRRRVDGTVNTAYVQDGDTTVTHSDVTHSDVTDRDDIQANYYNVMELPDVVEGQYERVDDHTVNLGVMKHRHMTIV